MTAGGLQLSVLGSIEATIGGEKVDLGGRKQRTVLAMLAVRAPAVVPVTTLVEAVWGDDPHDRAANTLQVYISNLRRALEPDRPPKAPPTVLLTQEPGYRLEIGPDQLDLLAVGGDLARLRSERDAGHLPAAAQAAEAALARWRGTPLAGAEDTVLVLAERVRLEELHLTAAEDRIEIDLALGRHRDLVPQLERLTAEHPFRERLHGQLMLALYRSDRQSDALRAYANVRSSLVEELGIEPSPALRDLEAAVLAQSPALRWSPDTANGPGTDGAGGADHTTRVVRGGAAPGALVLADGRRHVLDGGTCAIGRRSSSDLQLADDRVSRDHARLEPSPAGWVLQDLDSTNGTEVNGQAVRVRVLASGDEISFGGVTARFEG